MFASEDSIGTRRQLHRHLLFCPVTSVQTLSPAHPVRKMVKTDSEGDRLEKENRRILFVELSSFAGISHLHQVGGIWLKVPLL